MQMNTALIHARKEKNMTQEYIAVLAGIDRSTYAHYERGRAPYLETAVKIAKILDKPVEQIFFSNNVLNKHIANLTATLPGTTSQ